LINILYALNGVFHKGGTEAVVLNYYNNIDKEKFHIDFLVHGYENENFHNETHNYLKSKGSRIFYVTPRGKNFLKNKKEIKKVLKNNHFHIVHSHMDAAGSFFLKEAKKAAIKVRIAHSHNTENQINKGNVLKDKAYSIILNNARKSITNYGNVFLSCSKEAGDWLFGNKPYKVINNGIDISKYVYSESIRKEYREQLGISDKIVIGHVGRFCYQKNQELLINMFNELNKKNDKYFLIMIGEGETKEEIELKINDLGLNNKILIMNSETKINEVIQAFDIFVLPSRFEGLGIVAIEAQAADLTCLISDNVPNEVKITERIKFIPLTDSPEVWVREIINIENFYERKDKNNEIKLAGYDVKDVIKRVEKIYIEMLKKMDETVE